MAVYRAGKYATTAWKRYSAFHKLHAELAERMGPQSSLLPPLPPKIRGQGVEPAVVRARRGQLCGYVNHLLQVVPSRLRPQLDDFLHINRPPIPLPQASSAGSPAADGNQVNDDDNMDEVATAQRIAGECHSLVAELAQELRTAEVAEDTVNKVEVTAKELVELVDSLASIQQDVWGPALQAVRLAPRASSRPPCSPPFSSVPRKPA